MPYNSVKDALKTNPGLKKYSDKARRAWVKAFNSCIAGSNKEETCFAIAYASANNVDGRKATRHQDIIIADALLQIVSDLVQAPEVNRLSVHRKRTFST